MAAGTTLKSEGEADASTTPTSPTKVVESGFEHLRNVA